MVRARAKASRSKTYGAKEALNTGLSKKNNPSIEPCCSRFEKC